MLINKVLDIFKSSEVVETVLHVKQSNTIAYNLYEKLGFAVIQTLPNYYGDEDGFLMAKFQFN